MARIMIMEKCNMKLDIKEWANNIDFCHTFISGRSFVRHLSDWKFMGIERSSSIPFSPL
jgi:hypothetical protein